VIDGPALDASFAGPSSFTVGADGTIYVGDQPYYSDMYGGSTRVRSVSQNGTVISLAGNEHTGWTYTDGVGSFASFSVIGGVAVDALGSVYVSDTYNNNIRKVWPNQTVVTLAGSGNELRADGFGTYASFNQPRGVAVDPYGNLYVADKGNARVCRVSAAGTVTTLAGSLSYGHADGIGTYAAFNAPALIAADADGYVYVTDGGYGNNADGGWIRKISPLGVVSTLKTFVDGSWTDIRGLAVDKTGAVYVAYAQCCTLVTFKVIRLAANGNESQVIPAVNYTHGIAIGPDGTLYMGQYSESDSAKRNFDARILRA
jgi:sugar lactone lactonase YvrE